MASSGSEPTQTVYLNKNATTSARHARKLRPRGRMRAGAGACEAESAAAYCAVRLATVSVACWKSLSSMYCS